MRNLLPACAALVVILGVVSGNLWHELRSARQLIVGLQDQLATAKIPVAQSAPVQAPPLSIEAPPVASVAVQLPEADPLPPPAALPPPPPPVRVFVPVPVPVTAPERPLGLPTLTQPLVGSNDEERRVEALAQSDRTAASRVASWNTALNLAPEQLQVLNATTAAELRRETEDSLQITSRTGPMDALSVAQLKVETVNRQYETLTRIADKMAPELTPEQSNRMRTMFASWLTNNMARARAEEQAVLDGR